MIDSRLLHGESRVERGLGLTLRNHLLKEEDYFDTTSDKRCTSGV